MSTPEQRAAIDAEAAAGEAAFETVGEETLKMTYNDLIKQAAAGFSNDNVTYYKKVSGGIFGKAKIEQQLLGPFVRSYEEGPNVVLCFEKKSLKVPKTFIKNEGDTTILFKRGLPDTTPAPTSVGSKELEIGPPTNVQVTNVTPELREKYSQQVKGKLAKLGGRKTRRRNNKKKSTRRRKH